VSTPAYPLLEPGRVYRTRDFAKWGKNAPRLAKRLVQEGKLVPLANGLFAHQRQSKFGSVPASDEEVLRAFLGGSRFVFTGPESWNALGLGTTAMFANPLVYNTKRSGTFELGQSKFVLRRVAFPEVLTPEWYVVDLLENASTVGASLDDLEKALARALVLKRFRTKLLLEMASIYGTKNTASLVARAVDASKVYNAIHP
jgi:hypothetical protein